MAYRTILFISLLLVLAFFNACEKDEPDIDTLIDFEDLTVNTEGYWNGSDRSGGFTEDNAFFPNTYREFDGAGYWSGFAYSNAGDTITPGIENQYSSYAGKGANNSTLFGIVYTFDSDTLVFEEPQVVTSLAVTNTTYAAISMREGDTFSKRFGGEDGTDEDYFILRITGIRESGDMAGYFDIYLADYRSQDPAGDYIAKAWTEVTGFEDFGELKYLSFSFDSSDKGEYGINTPTYACIDNIRGYIPR